ncbi:hypothetical protein DVH05_005331 [Phytophthora capsici]|nr:hypothetical protein DVH05_005331 [Phytophthora capsici]
MAAFPALDRAKKLFLLRKDAEKRREEDAHEESDDFSQTRKNSRSVEVKDRRTKRQETATAHQCTTGRPLIAFCLDFDEQLQLINSDLKLLNTSVRREYQRESLALEKLTTKFLDRNVEWLDAPPLKKPRCHIRVPSRKPRIKLQVVFQRKAPVAKPPTNPKTLSPAVLAALQTVKACVIQSNTRRYLYHCLYPGGRRQLVLASQLAIRCRFSRAFRHWRRVVTQRLKLRLRCYRAHKRIEDCRTSFARSRAFQVVETEGKYAMAKTFHHSKLLASSFSYWLR